MLTLLVQETLYGPVPVTVTFEIDGVAVAASALLGAYPKLATAATRTATAEPKIANLFINI
jgi:hypothetical protein